MKALIPSDGQTPQVKEALYRRNSYHAVVTPLQDGSFAVFANDRSLETLLIVSNPDDLILAIVSRANLLHRKTPSAEERPPRKAMPTQDFAELDFSSLGI